MYKLIGFIGIFFYLFEFDCFDRVDVALFAGREEPNNDHKRLAQTGIDQLSTKTKIQTLKYPDF